MTTETKQETVAVPQWCADAAKEIKADSYQLAEKNFTTEHLAQIIARYAPVNLSMKDFEVEQERRFDVMRAKDAEIARLREALVQAEYWMDNTIGNKDGKARVGILNALQLVRDVLQIEPEENMPFLEAANASPDPVRRLTGIRWRRHLS